MRWNIGENHADYLKTSSPNQVAKSGNNSPYISGSSI